MKANKIIIVLLILLVAAMNISCEQTDMWSKAGEVGAFIVIYIPNGSTSGDAPIDSGVYKSGDIVTIAGNTGNLIRTKYLFEGWNTEPELVSSGTTYNQGDTLIMGTSDITLYAKWIPTYTVTYDQNEANTGTVPIDLVNYVSGAEVIVLGNSGTLERTGYSFNGWNTQADSNGTTYNPGDPLTMGTADITLYAEWIPTYTVTYDQNEANTGTVPIYPGNYVSGAEVIVLGNSGTLERTGYSFNGWNTQADSNGTTYNEGNTLTMGTADITLYAQWTIQ